MLPLIFLSAPPACTVINGSTPTGGRYTYATLGGDATNLDLSPEGTKAGTVETAPSFREVASVAKTAVVVSGLVDGTNAVTNAVKSVKNTKTAATVSKDAAAQATEQQRIAADLAAKVAETNAAGGFAQ